MSNSEVKFVMIERLKFFEIEEIDDVMVYQIKFEKISQEKHIRSRNSRK